MFSYLSDNYGNYGNLSLGFRKVYPLNWNMEAFLWLKQLFDLSLTSKQTNWG